MEPLVTYIVGKYFLPNHNPCNVIITFPTHTQKKKKIPSINTRLLFHSFTFSGLSSYSLSLHFFFLFKNLHLNYNIHGHVYYSLLDFVCLFFY